jgi:type IV pilus assembly protein PilQ
VTACAWSSSPPAPGNTAPTRATTSSCWKCGPVKIDPNKLTQGPASRARKLSLNFQNIEVRALLQVIADFTNFNVVTSDTVTGTVTLRLKDVPWDQALDIIMQSKGLGVRKNGNVLWIAPKDELAAKEQVDLESKKKVADLEPTAHAIVPAQLHQGRGHHEAKGLTGQTLGSRQAAGGRTTASCRRAAA